MLDRIQRLSGVSVIQSVMPRMGFQTSQPVSQRAWLSRGLRGEEIAGFRRDIAFKPDAAGFAQSEGLCSLRIDCAFREAIRGTLTERISIHPVDRRIHGCGRRFFPDFDCRETTLTHPGDDRALLLHREVFVEENVFRAHPGVRQDTLPRTDVQATFLAADICKPLIATLTSTDEQ